MREKGKEKEFFLPFSSVISYLCTQIAKRHGPQSRQDMTEEERWHWQEPGTAWRGIGVYHVTLTVPSREPLLGRLVIPDGDPALARIERTALGNAVVDELYVMCRHYPEVRILQFCLMPDHLHAVVYVTKVMKASIRSVVRGYWQGVKKLGRAYSQRMEAGGHGAVGSASVSASVSGASSVSASVSGASSVSASVSGASSVSASVSVASSVSAELNSATMDEGLHSATMDKGGGGFPFPVFTERPFIRPLSRRGQLQTMIHYVQMNPQRLATKRMKPGFFRVQKDIVIGNRKYDAVGNVALLTQYPDGGAVQHSGGGAVQRPDGGAMQRPDGGAMRRYDVVHVRSVMVKAAERGERQALRDYMNSRVLMARKGTVMVSPFISMQERQVMEVLLKEQRPVVLLTGDGFREYYKPADYLFEACAAGRLLILSPWPYDGGKRHLSRADCVALNGMAEEICQQMNGEEA